MHLPLVGIAWSVNLIILEVQQPGAINFQCIVKKLMDLKKDPRVKNLLLHISNYEHKNILTLSPIENNDCPKAQNTF